MEPRAKSGSNLDTCKRGPPLLKLMFYGHREDAVGGGRAGNGKHTHTHTVSLVIQRIGADAILTHVSMALR